MSKEPQKLEHIRHSLAHLLAAAVMELWPDTKRTIGPAIDDGFYFDFAFAKPITEADLPTIEEAMRRIGKTWTTFTRSERSAADAKAAYPGNQYKHELIEEFTKDGSLVSFYSSGTYEDLCRGGHVEDFRTVDLSGFVLDRVAGAYWRGDEKNTMLTRIYGLAFANKKELKAYQAMLVEAKKRDHRKLGQELEIFAYDDDIGPGLPLWLPNGTTIIEELERLAKETERKGGYVRVRTPHIAKESLFLTSGHLPYYKDSMYPPMEYEDTKYYLKAMNCPPHHKIYAVRPRSYRELPLRMAEYGTVYRHEKSGELFGLMRVRMLSMNDAHIYCTEEQFADEFRRVNEMYLKYFAIFGIEKYVMRLSLHAPDKLGKKYVDEPELWQKTETMVRDVLVQSNIPFVEVQDEAAFYGPKIDVQVWSAIGREFTLATNQVDFAVPRRFNLTYADRDGTAKSPIVIHRAPLGTHERFIGFLIEHYGGAFPTWMSPVQIGIVPVSDEHNDAARALATRFGELDLRAEVDEANETVGKKIRNAAGKKYPYILVVGDKEKDGTTVAVRARGQQETETIPTDAFIARVVAEIRERKA